LATGYILKQIKLENPDRRIFVVMNADMNGIYDNVENDKLLFLHELMRRYCAELDIEFLDLSDPMRKAFQMNEKKFNSEFDAHWNNYGHDFVYQQIVKLL